MRQMPVTDECTEHELKNLVGTDAFYEEKEVEDDGVGEPVEDTLLNADIKCEMIKPLTRESTSKLIKS